MGTKIRAIRTFWVDAVGNLASRSCPQRMIAAAAPFTPEPPSTDQPASGTIDPVTTTGRTPYPPVDGRRQGHSSDSKPTAPRTADPACSVHRDRGDHPYGCSAGSLGLNPASPCARRRAASATALLIIGSGAVHLRRSEASNDSRAYRVARYNPTAPTSSLSAARIASTGSWSLQLKHPHQCAQLSGLPRSILSFTARTQAAVVPAARSKCASLISEPSPRISTQVGWPLR